MMLLFFTVWKPKSFKDYSVFLTKILINDAILIKNEWPNYHFMQKYFLLIWMCLK